MAVDSTTVFNNFHTSSTYFKLIKLTAFPSIKIKIDERHTKKSSFNIAHRAVIEGSPLTCHFTSFLRGLRSRRNSGETQQLDLTQGLSQPITARLFSTAVPFPALSILIILLDKCQIKSFENINNLIQAKLFCLKKFLREKPFI